MDDEQIYLRQEALFSVIVRRIVAPMFFVGGIVVGGYNIVRLVTTGSVLVEGKPTDDWFFVAVSILLPAVVAILGLLLFRAKPHYIRE